MMLIILEAVSAEGATIHSGVVCFCGFGVRDWVETCGVFHAVGGFNMEGMGVALGAMGKDCI